MELLETMRRRRVNAMIADANFLSKQEKTAETKEAKERERRHAMYEHSLGRITLVERDEILQLLNGRK